jgi:outer membrane protein, multidrug efflux system
LLTRSRILKPPLPARLLSGPLKRSTLTLSIGFITAFLSGCASLTPNGGLGDVQQLTQGRTAGVDVPLQRHNSETAKAVAKLLAAPVSAESAVRIALLNNPVLQGALATLDISDAARTQAGQLPNPHLMLGRFTDGDVQEIERVLRFDVVGLLFLPWKAQWQGRQHELAKLQAAQEVIRLAADTRKAWILAVTAQQTVRYLEDVKEAAEAGAELAQRMARLGNWSRLQQAREQLFLTEATTQLTRARQTAVSAREKLTRLMGLGDLSNTAVAYTLVSRLPDLPAQADDIRDVEQRALRERRSRAMWPIRWACKKPRAT